MLVHTEIPLEIPSHPHCDNTERERKYYLHACKIIYSVKHIHCWLLPYCQDGSSTWKL